MRHEVVLVEELGALGGLGYQSLSLADVAHDDTAHVGVELLSRQLQVLISPQLLLPQLGQTPNLLPPQLHKLPFLFFVLGPATLMVGLVGLRADGIHFDVALLLFVLRAFADFLGVRFAQGYVGRAVP